MITEQKHLELCDEFIFCLSEQRFYDAHEALEEIWFPRRFENNDEVKLLKGFINAAVSFELVKQGRLNASEKVWKNYIKYKVYLEQLDSEYKPIYKQLVANIEKIKELKKFNN